jgi:ribosomal protein S2
MKRTPDVLFVVDGVYEAQAVREANSLGLTSFAIMNTNGDDTSVTNMIPANTNSVKSTEYIANAIKKELAGTKVKSTGAKIQKIAQKKVSGEKKAPAKKTVAKKEDK